jgi:hypothetical protein
MSTAVRVVVLNSRANDQTVKFQEQIMKYKIEVRWDRWSEEKGKKEVIPLPKDKVTGISWTELVKVIADNGIGIAKNIRHHSVGQEGGTAQIDRKEMFALWRQVEETRQRTQNPQLKPH